jgi:hypothetical protein
MPAIEFIYDQDCPNVVAARNNLAAALKFLNFKSAWQEWERRDARAPAHARHYGSPTILVNGKDIAGVEPASEPSCRIYSTQSGKERGVPSVELIIAALRAGASAGGGWRGAMSRFGAAVPVVGAVLLPKLTCAACWPAYAGLLSALGVGFVDYTPYLFPLTTGFLALTLATLTFRARSRWGYAPLALGVVSALTVLIGKFGFDSDNATYLGLAVLVVASAWNAWPVKKSGNVCAACMQTS